MSRKDIWEIFNSQGTKDTIKGCTLPDTLRSIVGILVISFIGLGWEKAFLLWCDMTPAVLAYGSEEMVIPYISPLDGKPHRYFVDFFVVVRQSNGGTKKFAVEIKPLAQTRPPKITKRVLTESLKYQLDTYAVNQAKWEAAKKFCNQQGIEFIILTEVELLKGKKKR